MGEWVAKTKGKNCVRRVDTASRYPINPANLAGQCHTDGKIWSATLWDLHQKLGRATTDKLVLMSHYLVKRRPKFVDNGEAIVLADKRLNDNNNDGEGDNKDEICEVLENRGISVKSCAIKCDSRRHAGGDTGVTVSVDLGQKSGSFDFYYQTYFIKDQLKVRYQNRTLLDTGCVGATETKTLNFNGNSKFVTVEVNPNCDGNTSGTAWVFEVRCPTR